MPRSRALATAVLAAVSLAAGAFTSLPANAAADFTRDDLFTMNAITRVMIAVPPASFDSLNRPETWRKYVPATVQFVQGDKQSAVMNVGLRIKGTTSQAPISEKPSLKVKFNWSDTNTGVRFLGLRLITLNAMSQDGSFIHEYGAYKLYRDMGVIAPTTGWAEVFINGVSRGAYLNVESIDEVFVRSHFADSSQHLYEATARTDLTFGSDGGGESSGTFIAKDGWKTTPNKHDLSKLIQVAQLAAGTVWWKRLNAVMDVPRLLAAFAVENFIGSWDSYSGPVVNNYFLRSNSSGKFTLIPSGPDNTFGEWRIPDSDPTTSFFMAMDTPRSTFPWITWADQTNDTWPRGILFQKCLKYSACKVKYLLALKRTAETATTAELRESMRAAALVIDALSSDTVRQQQTRTLDYITRQQARVATLLRKNNVH